MSNAVFSTVFLSVLLGSLLSIGAVSSPLLVSAAQAEPTEAVADTSQSAQFRSNQFSSNKLEEEFVAIGQVSKHNDGVNDTVLNNKAINDMVSTASGKQNSQSNNQQTDSARAVEKTVTSSAETVASDKLILNNPVIDEANILSSAEKQQLSNKLRAIYQQGLAQAAVVIVPSTDGVSTFNYAMQVADRWQLGEKDTDDGLLILVAVNDRDMYILTGYGLEGTLPDGAVGRVIRNEIRPYFKQGDFAGGLLAGINRMEERLTADPQVLSQADKNAEKRNSTDSSGASSGVDPIVIFFLCIFFGNIVTAIFGRVLGGTLVSGGFFLLSMSAGASFFMSLVLAIFLWIFLVGNDSNGKGGGRGGKRRRGRTIVVPGNFGGGGFGSGGSGGFGGGFGGGGGGFGGGGAGGSW